MWPAEAPVARRRRARRHDRGLRRTAAHRVHHERRDVLLHRRGDRRGDGRRLARAAHAGDHRGAGLGPAGAVGGDARRRLGADRRRTACGRGGSSWATARTRRTRCRRRRSRRSGSTPGRGARWCTSTWPRPPRRTSRSAPSTGRCPRCSTPSACSAGGCWRRTGCSCRTPTWRCWRRGVRRWRTAPGSNAKLAAGVARVTALRRAGVRVGLGTDGPASGDDLDLWAQARLAGLLARVGAGDAAALTAAELLLMATRDGAAAIGRPDLGVLEAGAWADLVHVDLDDPVFTDPADDAQLLSNLVWAGGARLVTDVWVAGEAVLAGGEPTRVDRAATTAGLRAAGSPRAAPLARAPAITRRADRPARRAVTGVPSPSAGAQRAVARPSAGPAATAPVAVRNAATGHPRANATAGARRRRIAARPACASSHPRSPAAAPARPRRARPSTRARRTGPPTADPPTPRRRAFARRHVHDHTARHLRRLDRQRRGQRVAAEVLHRRHRATAPTTPYRRRALLLPTPPPTPRQGGEDRRVEGVLVQRVPAVRPSTLRATPRSPRLLL